MNGHHIDRIEVDGGFPFELFVRVPSVVQKVIVKRAEVVLSAIARGLELPLAIAFNLPSSTIDMLEIAEHLRQASKRAHSR